MKGITRLTYYTKGERAYLNGKRFDYNSHHVTEKGTLIISGQWHKTVWLDKVRLDVALERYPDLIYKDSDIFYVHTSLLDILFNRKAKVPVLDGVFTVPSDNFKIESNAWEIEIVKEA